MTDDALQRLERRAQRERVARKRAEALLEERSRELFVTNEALMRLTASLEQQVAVRTLELEQALQRAETATQAKTSFLATMSHELRTPMNGVLGMAQLLQDEPLSDLQRHCVGTIVSSGELLLSLIDDVLDFSKVEADRMQLEALPYSPRASIAAVSELVRPLVHEKGLTFRVQIRPEVPQRLIGDDMRLRQIASSKSWAIWWPTQSNSPRLVASKSTSRHRARPHRAISACVYASKTQESGSLRSVSERSLSRSNKPMSRRHGLSVVPDWVWRLPVGLRC